MQLLLFILIAIKSFVIGKRPLSNVLGLSNCANVMVVDVHVLALNLAMSLMESY